MGHWLMLRVAQWPMPSGFALACGDGRPSPSSHSTALPQSTAVQEPKAKAMGHWLMPSGFHLALISPVGLVVVPDRSRDPI